MRNAILLLVIGVFFQGKNDAEFDTGGFYVPLARGFGERPF